jgi:6-phosphogluconolactonase (cycloisomerase 2 family)
VERCLTEGSGSGAVNYRSYPLGLVTEGVNSIVLTPNRRFLFAVNAGDNSVSSFSVGEDGKLTLLNAKRTGNIVTGKSGTAKSLAYAPSSGTLYVLHSFGPDYIRLMSVDHEGRLTARPEGYSATTQDKPNRVPTMVVLSPDEQFLLVGSTLDELPSANPDGTAIVWVQRNGRPHSIASNAPDPDGS